MPVSPPQPFRWALSSYGDARPDRLGTLVPDGRIELNDWFLGGLTECTAKILARAVGADLCFLGRSLDSVYDLLTGALEGAPREGGLRRLPVSCSDDEDWTPAEKRRFREHLASAGLDPYSLARRTRPVALVDMVRQGRSFDTLHRRLAAWVEESGEPWPVIRRKLRYIGVTEHGVTGPKHEPGQQNPEYAWAHTLPAGNVANVAMDRWLWTYLADQQPKATRQFPSKRWLDGEAEARPFRHEYLADVLNTAQALVAAGRTRAVRDELIRHMSRDPAFAHRESRHLARALHTGAPG